jgi:hypothetical protein
MLLHRELPGVRIKVDHVLDEVPCRDEPALSSDRVLRNCSLQPPKPSAADNLVSSDPHGERPGIFWVDCRSAVRRSLRDEDPDRRVPRCRGAPSPSQSKFDLNSGLATSLAGRSLRGVRQAVRAKCRLARVSSRGEEVSGCRGGTGERSMGIAQSWPRLRASASSITKAASF